MAWQKVFPKIQRARSFRQTRFKLKKAIGWNKTKYSICGFKLALGSSDGVGEEIFNVYLDIVFSKDHAFIRNIFDYRDLENCKQIKAVENHKSFNSFHQIVVFLNTKY